ncbi:MAG: serine hydrolase domain-containing protein [Acetatifactor sp.]
MATKKDVDNLLQSFIERGLPGCSLHVVQRGTILYEGYFGVTDIESGKKVDVNSVFRLASMSKIPLYTALMMLYEQGKFLMTDPIGDYLPEWKNSTKFVKREDGSFDVVPTSRPLIIKDALTMKCGLPYCNFDGPTDDIVLKGMQECMRPLWKKGHYTLAEHLRAMAKAPLACDPGEQWIYGFSSEIAAGLIEAICDKPINEVLRNMLYDPLGMTSTDAVFFGDIQSRLVSLYARDASGSLVPGPTFFDKKHLPGAENEQGWGRVFTTGRDFSRLMQMLACGGEFEGHHFMGRKTIDLLRTNTLGGIFSDHYNGGYGYGYGFRTLVDKNAANANGSIGAFGWTGGFGTWCEADPEEGLSIVYMHNLMPNDEAYYHPRVRAVSYGLVDNGKQ